MCDELYGDGQPFLLSSLKKNYKVSLNQEAEIPMLNRQALHAWKLSFTWKGHEISGEAPLPKDMRATLQQLRKRSQPNKR
jgi:23S rRNA pseudouridine955/2504/2580 synthase/23S rRNA pseudouridine1911/1915/1917 synthase